MSKILITGASGFIGSHLVEEALAQQHEVYAGVRSSSNLKYLQDPRIHIIHMDLMDPNKLVDTWKGLKQEMEPFDYVIHNAGVTQVVNPDDFRKVNCGCTTNLVESLVAAEFRPQKFVLMSSLAAHGPGDAQTLSPIEPSHTPNPITQYGKSKRMAEQYLESQNEIPYLIFRPTGVYGPREKDYLTFFKTINNHFEPYIGSPKQLLSFIYVKDLAALLISSLQSPITGKSYFVSDGNNYTCAEFAAITKKTLDKWTMPLIFPKPLVKLISMVSERIADIFHKTSLLNSDKYKELTSLNWSCNSVQTQRDFSFSPRYDLEKGVSEAIQWYQKNQWL